MKLITIILGLILATMPILSQAKQVKMCPDIKFIQGSANKLNYVEEPEASEPNNYFVRSALPTVFFDNTFWYLITTLPAKNKLNALIKGKLNVKATYNSLSKVATESFGVYFCAYESLAGGTGGDVFLLGLMFENQKLPELNVLKAGLATFK
jgi:hypothetical protein